MTTTVRLRARRQLCPRNSAQFAVRLLRTAENATRLSEQASSSKRGLLRKVDRGASSGLVLSAIQYLPMPLFGKFAFAALSAVCLTGNATAAGEAWQTAANTHSQIVKNCPAREHVEGALSTASSLMEQAKYQDAAATLQPLASLGCDARVSLLLAAAFEASGDVPKTKETLQKAHTAWPANTGIAASLAREYTFGGPSERSRSSAQPVPRNSGNASARSWNLPRSFSLPATS